MCNNLKYSVENTEKYFYNILILDLWLHRKIINAEDYAGKIEETIIAKIIL